MRIHLPAADFYDGQEAFERVAGVAPMFLLAGPLCLLYFIALGVCLLIDKRRVEAGEEPDWSDLPDDQASPLR